jgi:KUP system potassium uptake protein
VTELVPRPGAVEEHRSRRTGRAGPQDAAHAGTLALGLAALGVVFGDIGTSPLYAFRTVFSIDGGVVRPTPGDVHGVVSLVFWSILLIVSVKYVVFVLRATTTARAG